MCVMILFDPRLGRLMCLFLRGRLLRPRPTFRGVWLGVLLLWGAAAIILPIICAEGIRPVFFPWSMPRQRVSASDVIRRSSSSRVHLANEKNADLLRTCTQTPE